MRWTSQVTDTLVTDTAASFSPAGPLTSSFTAGEGQKVVAHLTSKDVYDQPRTQTFVAYADGPLTPDYVWLDALTAAAPFGSSDCTLIGVDRRVARHAAGNAMLSAEQTLRASWNTEALRLSWAGANWNSDGDLFIYLDTIPGNGSTQVFDPYPATAGQSNITLPAGLAADRLVWVRDAGDALLLSWDGSAWGSGVALDAAHYRFGASAADHRSIPPVRQARHRQPGDLPAGLIALASEEGALRLWATLPNTNPVNSARSVTSLAGTRGPGLRPHAILPLGSGRLRHLPERDAA